MEILIIIFIFLSYLTFLINSQAFDDSPVIHFPFQHSGFKISYKEKKPMISFQSYGGILEVKSITYETKTLTLIDPRNCVNEVFMNLNLSETPFKYYYVLKEYRYINCSSKLPIPFIEIPCLSAHDDPGIYYVYTVEPSFPVPDSCKSMKSVGIPFPYSPYLSDNSFGLRLTWDLAGGENHELNSQVQSETGCLKKWIDIIYYKALGLAMFVFMVVTLAILKTSYLDDDEENKQGKKSNAIEEAERLLGDCEEALLEPSSPIMAMQGSDRVKQQYNKH